jgi:hypothetical protein
LCLAHLFNEARWNLGMQLKFSYLRRTQFAPIGYFRI